MTKQLPAVMLISALCLTLLRMPGLAIAEFPSQTHKTDTPPVSTPSVDQKAFDRGRKVMENQCGMCHKPYQPQDFSWKHWPGLVKRMAPKASLRQSEIDALLYYLEISLKTKVENPAP